MRFLTLVQDLWGFSLLQVQCETAAARSIHLCNPSAQHMLNTAWQLWSQEHLLAEQVAIRKPSTQQETAAALLSTWQDLYPVCGKRHLRTVRPEKSGYKS